MKCHIVLFITAACIAGCASGSKSSLNKPDDDVSPPATQSPSIKGEAAKGKAAAGPAEPVVLPGYGCVGTLPVSRGLSIEEAEQVVRAATGNGKYFVSILPFVGADQVQRIAILYYDGEDEYGEAHAAVRERDADGRFNDLHLFEVDRFSKHSLTLVDADRDGNPEVLYDGYDGGSGAYIYRTVLYSPTRKETFWLENSWARTEAGDNEPVLTESLSLKSESGKSIRDWFVAHVNGYGNGDTNDGGLKTPCGDAVTALPPAV